MNVLAVGAHPDDVEILCSGTLALYAQRGDAVWMGYLATGDKGGTGVPLEEMAGIRRKELENAARVIGAQVLCLGLPDGDLEVTLAMRRRVVEIVRQAQADLIITHHPNDYASDHNCTSQLVSEAAFWAMPPDFAGDPGDAPALAGCPPVFTMETVGGIGFVPQEYVDITSVMDMKLDMVSQHESQIRFMKERDGLDLVDYVRTMAKFRGYQCGVEFAEGFIPERVYPSLSPKRMLP